MTAHVDGARVVAAARAWIGTPYQHQAALRGVGADCLGVLRGMWFDLYGVQPEAPPAYAARWAQPCDEDTLLEAARRHLVSGPNLFILPGDVLLFRYRPHLPCKHLAIAVDATRMIHAYEGAAVAETSLTPWWARRLAARFVFPERLP